jgi:hypothetical protein
VAANFLRESEPPWVVFPHLVPDELASHLKQGVAEPWFDQVWRPLWSRLSASERAEYLDHWNASPEWREAIRFSFDDQEKVDLVADAAESERELEEFRRARTRPRSFLDRLFRRK